MTTPATIPDLISKADLAARLTIKPRTLMDWVAAGDFPAPVVNTRENKAWHPDDVLAWLKSRRPIAWRA